MIEQIHFKVLTGKADEMLELQKVLESAPNYSLKVSGSLPSSAESQSLFSALPPGKEYKDKFVLGFYSDNEMFGCADIIRGYPNEKVAMIGLLLMSEKFQNQGFGRMTYGLVENLCLSWPEIERARIGVVETNSLVMPFWEKMGFLKTGERKSYSEGIIESTNVVLEKIIKM